MASIQANSSFDVPGRVGFGRRKQVSSPTPASTTESIRNSEAQLPKPIEVFPYRSDSLLANAATQKKDHADHDISRIALASCDSGASESFISQKYIANVLEVPFDTSYRPAQATGWKFDTLGSLRLGWVLQEAVLPEVRHTTFYVTGPDSAFDVLLGQSALNPDAYTTREQSKEQFRQSSQGRRKSSRTKVAALDSHKSRGGVPHGIVQSLTCGILSRRSKRPVMQKEEV